MKYIFPIILVVSLFAFSCEKDTENTNQLEVLSSYDISVPEPSGLAINSAGNILYTVSDHTNKVYKLSMAGALLHTYDFTGNDLEGICNYNSGKLLLAQERTKTVVEYTIANNTHINHVIDYENNDENSGVEGITYNSSTQNIYILNEKDPGKLIVLDTNFSIVNSYNLDFANDYSGLFYDATDDLLWIISDQSQSINKCSLTGELLESFKIGVTKPEGIVISNNKIYIVSDSEEKLYLFEKPQ